MGAHTPSLTHTVYSAQWEEPRPTHSRTQWQTGHCPRTADWGRAAGGRTAQRRLGDPEPDKTPSQRTYYSGRATNGTTNTKLRRCTPSLDGTEYSATNTDYSHTPRHKAQHHDYRDNVPVQEP